MNKKSEGSSKGEAGQGQIKAAAVLQQLNTIVQQMQTITLRGQVENKTAREVVQQAADSLGIELPPAKANGPRTLPAAPAVPTAPAVHAADTEPEVTDAD